MKTWTSMYKGQRWKDNSKQYGADEQMEGTLCFEELLNRLAPLDLQTSRQRSRSDLPFDSSLPSCKEEVRKVLEQLKTGKAAIF
mgnify:CR=1 FL=1